MATKPSHLSGMLRLHNDAVKVRQEFSRLLGLHPYIEYAPLPSCPLLEIMRGIR